jgi:hypothetical protein
LSYDEGKKEMKEKEKRISWNGEDIEKKRHQKQ